MNIFVGNLSFDAVEADVKKLFEGFGKVDSVVIVMQKDGKKSRGFAFVEMSGEEEAQAAITALNEKEFMGRVLNVEAGRPKSESDGEDRRKRQKPVNADVEFQQQGPEDEGKKEEINYNKSQFNQARPMRSGYNRYKEGRRSRGYMMRRAAAGTTEQAAPELKRQDNPMRWRKNSEHSKSWKRSYGESRPFRKDQGERRPWSKPVGESKPFVSSVGGEHRPFQKDQGERRPWSKPTGEFRQFGRRPVGESRPFKRSEGGQKPWRRAEGEAKPWKRSEGGQKPWKKPEGETKPWKRAEGEAKPWRKASGGPATWQKKPRSGASFRDSRKSTGTKRSWNKS